MDESPTAQASSPVALSLLPELLAQALNIPAHVTPGRGEVRRREAGPCPPGESGRVDAELAGGLPGAHQSIAHPSIFVRR